MTDLCEAAHPDTPGLLCTKPKPCFGVHYNDQQPDKPWPGTPLPTKQRGKGKVAGIAVATEPERRTGAPEVVRKADGMDRSLKITPEEFKEHFLRAVREVAQAQEMFTSDDVWAVLERRGIDTEVRTGVGPLMAAAARMGLAEKSGQHAVSTRPNSKARDGLTVWRSRIATK